MFLSYYIFGSEEIKKVRLVGAPTCLDHKTGRYTQKVTDFKQRGIRSGFLIASPLLLHKRKNPFDRDFFLCGAGVIGLEL